MDKTDLISSELRQRYLDALLIGDKRTCASIVQQLLDEELPVRTLFLDLFQDALYKVGELWEMNRITVATEHLATTITLALFQLVYPRVFAVERVGKTAIVLCTPDEHHHIGARMVSDICELHGWDSHFVGSHTPVADLCEMVQEKRPDFLGVSLTLYSNIGNLLHLLHTVRAVAPEVPILVGGQAFRDGGAEILNDFAGVAYHQSMDEFEHFLDAQSRIAHD